MDMPTRAAIDPHIVLAIRATGGGSARMDWDTLLAEVLQRSRRESERKQDRSRRTEQQILAAALRVFGRDGISRSRIADIAAEAGISTSTLYEYHTSKEDIAYAVPMSFLERFYEEFLAAVQGRTSARDRLLVYLSTLADFARRNAEWARLFYLEVWPSVLLQHSALSESIDDFSRIIVHLVRQGARDGEWSESADPYQTSAILSGGINQDINTWLLYRRPRNLTKAGGAMVERVLTMLENEQDAAPKGRTRGGAVPA